MTRLFYAVPVLLAFAASLVAEPPLAPTQPLHPRAAAALALVFAKAPTQSQDKHDPAGGDPFAPGNKAVKPIKLPPTCDCGKDCAGGKDCPGNCTPPTCINGTTKTDGTKGCTCGCEQTGKCKCANCDVGNKGDHPHCTCGCTENGSCNCHDCNHPQVGPLAVKRKFPRPDGKGYCSGQCTCGCNDGVPCRCGSESNTTSPTQPSFTPAQTRFVPALSLRNCVGGS